MGDGDWEMDETYKTYTKKFARNQTENARHERRRKGIERNLITEKKIKEKVIDEWCSCGVCKTGDYSNIKTDKCKLSIRDTGLTDIYLMEPVDKSNVRTAKQELDKLVRNTDVSILVMKDKS
jgi:hypothetical protein